MGGPVNLRKKAAFKRKGLELQQVFYLRDAEHGSFASRDPRSYGHGGGVPFVFHGVSLWHQDTNRGQGKQAEDHGVNLGQKWAGKNVG